MPDDGQSCTETVAFYNTLGCPLSKADRGPTKTLSSFIQDLQRSSLVNPPASPRAGTKPWLLQLILKKRASAVTEIKMSQKNQQKNCRSFVEVSRTSDHNWTWTLKSWAIMGDEAGYILQYEIYPAIRMKSFDLYTINHRARRCPTPNLCSPVGALLLGILPWPGRYVFKYLKLFICNNGGLSHHHHPHHHHHHHQVPASARWGHRVCVDNAANKRNTTSKPSDHQAGYNTAKTKKAWGGM